MSRSRTIFCFWVALLALALAGPADAAGGTVRLLSIEGPVTPAMGSYFERGIGLAEREGARIERALPGCTVEGF